MTTNDNDAPTTTNQRSLNMTPPPSEPTMCLNRGRSILTSRDPTPKPTCNEEIWFTDLRMAIDGWPVTISVDTGADCSVISKSLAARLKNITIPWESPHIRTAGSHSIIPFGRCTARIRVSSHTDPGSFVILQKCSPDGILGMDFLSEHRADIDHRSKLITILTNESMPPKTILRHHVALNFFDDEMIVPSRSSVIVHVDATDIKTIEGIIQKNTWLLFDWELGIAWGVACFRNGQAEVQVTNCSEEYPHLNKGTTIILLDKLTELRNVVALSHRLADDSPSQEAMPTFGINKALPRNKQD